MWEWGRGQGDDRRRMRLCLVSYPPSGHERESLFGIIMHHHRDSTGMANLEARWSSSRSPLNSCSGERVVLRCSGLRHACPCEYASCIISDVVQARLVRPNEESPLPPKDGLGQGQVPAPQNVAATLQQPPALIMHRSYRISIGLFDLGQVLSRCANVRKEVEETWMV
jgi:hypothetical protein